MAATKQDVDRWIAKAKKIGATHIISMCDSYDYSDYPVYVMPGEDLKKVWEQCNSKSMQFSNEIITIKE